MQTSFTFKNDLWKRLKKNKGAIFGLIVIIIAILVSVFGYVIAPDNSPNADLQTVEIQAKKPGYTQQFLKISINKKNNSNRFEDFLNGKINNYQFVPIKGFNISGDSLQVNKFIDDDTTVVQYYSINQLTNNNSASIKKNIITKKYWLGTDKFGRDILSRLIIGTRVSLAVGLIAVLISLTLGIILGALAGYYRGWIDEVIMWLINVTWSIPTLLLVFAITMAMGKGFWQIFIAVGLTMWVSVKRVLANIYCSWVNHVGKCGPFNSWAGNGHKRNGIHSGSKSIGLKKQKNYHKTYITKHTWPGDGNSCFKFCNGNYCGGRLKFFRHWCSTAATKLGINDKRKL